MLTLSKVTKRKAYLVVIWILIWFFFTSFGRKESNLTIKKLKHVQQAYNCIILQRECAPPLSTLNQFQFRPLNWSEIARFEIGGAINILIIATSFFFFLFIYLYSIRLLLHKHMLLPLNYWYYILNQIYAWIYRIFLIILSYISEWKTWKHTVIFYIVFCAHPFENHQKKSLPSHNFNFNMIFLYILW